MLTTTTPGRPGISTGRRLCILEELRELLLAGKAAETKQLYRNALDCYVSASVLLPGDERLVNKVARLKELAGVDENCTPNADATAASEQQDGEDEDIAELLFRSVHGKPSLRTPYVCAIRRPRLLFSESRSSGTTSVKSEPLSTNVDDQMIQPPSPAASVKGEVWTPESCCGHAAHSSGDGDQTSAGLEDQVTARLGELSFASDSESESESPDVNRSDDNSAQPPTAEREQHVVTRLEGTAAQTSHNWCDGGDGSGGNAVHAASAAAATSETAKFGGAAVVEAGSTLDVQEIKMEIKSDVEMRLLDVVNNGDEAQLRQLWGIGPKRACLIMEARATSPFRALEDLERIGMYRTQVIKATQALLSDDAC